MHPKRLAARLCAVALSLLSLFPPPARAASEIQAAAPSGRSLYAVIVSQAPGVTLGLAWHTTAWEAVGNAGWPGYALPLSEQGSTGLYLADFPPAITGAGRYLVVIYGRAGGSPAVGDAPIAQSALEWTGTQPASVAANAADLGVLKARIPQALQFDGSGNVSAHVRLSDDKSGYSAVATNLGSVTAPTAAQIRQEIDTNSSQLQALSQQGQALASGQAALQTNLQTGLGSLPASFWGYTAGPGRSLTTSALSGADHAAIALDVQTGLTAQGLTSSGVAALVRQVAQVADAEWGTITRNADGTYTVTRIDGGGARGTVRQTYDATGRVLQSRVVTGLN